MGRTMRALEFRPAVLNDAAFWSDVYTSATPARPVDPLITRHDFAHPGRAWVHARFVAQEGERAIGVGGFAHPHWDTAPKRFAAVTCELLPEYRDAARLAELHRFLEKGSIAAGAATIRTGANEDDPLRPQVLVSLGYREDRRSKRWELDLVANRGRILAMTEASRARMRAQDVVIRTLDRDPDPEVLRKLWRVSTEADQDIPTTLPSVEEPYDDFVDWFAYPGMHRDRFWLARRGDDVLGMSVLEYPPVRGMVGTAWTATARSARGQGIARALKCETLMQAMALGVDRVRTGNDGANDPILHINASMGYVQAPGRVDYLKDV
jgi:GNAT superfamily N-acetyltransferase